MNALAVDAAFQASSTSPRATVPIHRLASTSLGTILREERPPHCSNDTTMLERRNPPPPATQIPLPTGYAAAEWMAKRVDGDKPTTSLYRNRWSRKTLHPAVSTSQVVTNECVGGGFEESLVGSIPGARPLNATSRSVAMSSTATALAILPPPSTVGEPFSPVGGRTVTRAISPSSSEDEEQRFPLYGGPSTRSRPLASTKVLGMIVVPTDVRGRTNKQPPVSGRLSQPVTASTTRMPHPEQTARNVFPTNHAYLSTDISTIFKRPGDYGDLQLKSKGASTHRNLPDRLRFRNYIREKQQASVHHPDGPLSNGVLLSPRITIPGTGRTLPQHHADLMFAHSVNRLLPIETAARQQLGCEENTAYEYLLAAHMIGMRSLEWGRQQRYLQFHGVAADHLDNTPPPLSAEEQRRLLESVMAEYARSQQAAREPPRDKATDEDVKRRYDLTALDTLQDKSHKAIRRFVAASLQRKQLEEEALMEDRKKRGEKSWRVTSGGQRHHVLREVMGPQCSPQPPASPLSRLSSTTTRKELDAAALAEAVFVAPLSVGPGPSFPDQQVGRTSEKRGTADGTRRPSFPLPNCHLTPRPPALGAVHARNRTTAAVLRKDRLDRTVAEALQETVSQPVSPTTRHTCAPGETYRPPAPISPRTTIQTCKSKALGNDVTADFVVVLPLQGAPHSMGPLVSPSVSFPRATVVDRKVATKHSSPLGIKRNIASHNASPPTTTISHPTPPLLQNRLDGAIPRLNISAIEEVA